MCTHITETVSVTGSGKAGGSWFQVKEASVGYDHASQGDNEHALLLDFVNYNIGVGARLALEFDLESGKALLASLKVVIDRAEAAGLH